MGSPQSKNILMIGVGIVGFVALYGFVFSRGGNRDNSKPKPKPPDVENEQHDFHELNQQPNQAKSPKQLKLEEILKGLEVKYDGQHISEDTIISILQLSPSLVIEEYKNLTLTNREARRQLFQSDLNQYLDIILSYTEEVERLIEGAQIQMLEHLKIDVQKFEDSLGAIMQRGNMQQFFMLQAVIRQQIKESIPSKNSQNVAQAKTIIREQLEIVQEQEGYLKAAIQQITLKFEQDAEKLQNIPTIIGVIIADFVFQKRKIEEEDIAEALHNPALQQDQSLQMVIMQMEQYLMMLMGGPQFPEGQEDYANFGF